MKISAQVKNSQAEYQAIVVTNDNARSLDIPSKPGGLGSGVNGGELLFLALATCYCNDLYREAARRNIKVRHVQVEVSGEFDEAPGSRAENVTYKAIVEADASEEAILELMQHTDTVAEIQNTLRQATPIVLANSVAISLS